MSPLATPWDGVPVNPEQDGWHWIDDAPTEWIAATRSWRAPCSGEEVPPFDLAAEGWAYLGPVRTDADLGAAWAMGRDSAEECFWTLPATAPAEAIAMAPEEYGRRRDAARLAALQALTPPPDLGAALATALEQAREEERERNRADVLSLLDVGIRTAAEEGEADMAETLTVTRLMLAKLLARTPTTGEQADG
ncbi:hypothetical protein [Roseococcus pinisoli]|uniref:Uncharacterized protein n=1 Tax=Roseococcus pinisoli TaxID=2835040 RepID=A0ABS5QE14_9PROT|nr:hypothetical protein [Roseococcus pinisoli]MBS7811175.1 hypothetical protein [Roseococcus pinisoli]